MVEKLNGAPEAYAEIRGTKEYPEIHGRVTLYDVYGGTVLMAEIYGLPDEANGEEGQFLASISMKENPARETLLICSGTRKGIIIRRGGSTRSMPEICRPFCLPGGRMDGGLYRAVPSGGCDRKNSGHPSAPG